MAHNPHYIIYVIAFVLAAVAFGIGATGRFQGSWDLLGKTFFAIGCVFLFGGCTFSPDQAQAYAGAAHTLVHGALIDAKDAATVYDQMKESGK